MKTKLKSRYDEALKIFVERYKKDPNVIAILVSGSYIHSKPDKNSDLDVYVIPEKARMRERGNTWINGVEIEYFINPPSQIRYYFKMERDSPSTAHMFANSKILYQKGNTVNDLISEAKTILKRKLPKMSKIEIEFARYEIDDERKDMEDVFLNKDEFSFRIIAGNLLNYCLSTFFKFHRIPKEKSKRLNEYLKYHDKQFEKIFSCALIENDIEKKFKAVNELVSYVENLIGGKRPKEWKLRSKCTAK